MNQRQRQERDFFAQKLAKREWSEEDTQKMIDFFDPQHEGMSNTQKNEHIQQRLYKFTIEFEKWQRVQPQPEQSPEPMTDAEIAALTKSIK